MVELPGKQVKSSKIETAIIFGPIWTDLETSVNYIKCGFIEKSKNQSKSSSSTLVKIEIHVNE